MGALHQPEPTGQGPQPVRQPLFAPVDGRRRRGGRLTTMLASFASVFRAMRVRLGWSSTPLVLLLIVIGAILALIAFAQPLAPFLYPLF